MSASDSELKQKIKFQQHLSEAKKAFLDPDSAYFRPIAGCMRLYQIKLQDGTTLNIFGIPHEPKEGQNWDEIKSMLQNTAGIGPIQSIYQYVGISAAPGYSSIGTKFIENQMKAKLKENNYMFLYGATGCSNPNDTARANVNGCFNRVLDDCSWDECQRAFANVVDASKDVMEKHESSMSQNVRNIIYTYGTKEYETQFGDDNFVADGMTDVLIDYSGGPQSLAQVVDVLIKKKKAITVSGVRSQIDEEGFSSTGFLLLLRKALESKSSLTEDELKQFCEEYSQTKKIDFKWDSHTKFKQLEFAFTQILAHTPEYIIANIKFEACGQLGDRLRLFEARINAIDFSPKRSDFEIK